MNVFATLLLAAALFVFTACAPAGKPLAQGSIELRISDGLSSSAQALGTNATTAGGTAPAVQLSSDHCYFLMVSTFELHPDLNRGPMDPDKTGETCEQMPKTVGRTWGLFPVNGSLNIEVPAGANRRFDLFAIPKTPPAGEWAPPYDCKIPMTIANVDGRTEMVVDGNKRDTKVSHIARSGLMGIAPNINNVVELSLLETGNPLGVEAGCGDDDGGDDSGGDGGGDDGGGGGPLYCDQASRIASNPFANSGEVGAGTAANPFRICTFTQFDAMRTVATPGTYFRLEDDLDWTADAPIAWVPMGRPVTGIQLFEHHFDGNFHRITGFANQFSADANGTSYGLFGRVRNGTISRLVLDAIGDIGCEHNGSTDVRCGALAGSVASSTIEQVSALFAANSEVNSSGLSPRVMYVGGLIGHAEDSTLKDIFVKDVKITQPNASMTGGAGGVIGKGVGTDLFNTHVVNARIQYPNSVGGIAGALIDKISAPTRISRIHNGTVSAQGELSAATPVFGITGGGSGAGTGGLVGLVQASVIERSRASVTIKAAGRVGGLAGDVHNVRIADSIADFRDPSGVGLHGGGVPNVGGLIGSLTMSTGGLVKGSVAIGNITSAQRNVGGLIGYTSHTGGAFEVSLNSYQAESSGINGTSSTDSSEIGGAFGAFNSSPGANVTRNMANSPVASVYTSADIEKFAAVFNNSTGVTAGNIFNPTRSCSGSSACASSLPTGINSPAGWTLSDLQVHLGADINNVGVSGPHPYEFDSVTNTINRRLTLATPALGANGLVPLSATPPLAIPVPGP